MSDEAANTENFDPNQALEADADVELDAEAAPAAADAPDVDKEETFEEAAARLAAENVAESSPEEAEAEGDDADAAAEAGAEESAEALEGDAVANAAAALGDTTESDNEAAYRARLRKFIRDMKKQPGQWYIVQTYSGYENKVKTNLDMRSQTLEVEEYIHDVVVPIEQAVEIKDGKKKLVKRKLLPGYVLVRMDMNDSAWSVVRDTPGVTSFVGNEGNATPVKHRDVAKFLMPKDVPAEGEDAAKTTQDGEMVVAMPDSEEKPKVAIDFEVGDAVTILSGAFAAVSATISTIDPVTGKIEALVSLFGRETPVELTADQIEKIV
ncbi:transcription antitermination protein NusG [Corynebacterium maris DSM 45190]|uniref:Transcription termination/antitermination protein NusG n=1 Tax=Corynebacterium maris DSM 45190 TaxID=1224163 RepID=S5SSE7_9CORY|nr:transcription termination/antitermination protein NusG [Corynebacterium maris]AGS33947.1 transcription antitermination protein NusG [Corynebacterium maris DSM 45190]